MVKHNTIDRCSLFSKTNRPYYVRVNLNGPFLI